MDKGVTLPERLWFKEGLRSNIRSLLVVFYYHRRRDGKVVFRSYEEMGRFSGMSEGRAKKAVEKLRRMGLVKVERPGIYLIKKEGRCVKVPRSLGSGALTYKERAYLSLIWSLIPYQGDGKFFYGNLSDFMRLTGEDKKTVWNTIKDLHTKGLVYKERYGNLLRITPLYPTPP